MAYISELKEFRVTVDMVIPDHKMNHALKVGKIMGHIEGIKTLYYMTPNLSLKEAKAIYEMAIQ